MRNFTKEDTLRLKGVAILFMVFAHLFNNMELVSLSHPGLYLSGEPLVYLLIYGMNPVHFFIFLSGYGLYISYRKSQGTTARNKDNNYKRCLRLYIHYWITLAVFVPVGYFIVGAYTYPGSVTNCMYNIIGWKNTYNHETWFLLPYVLLVLSSNVIFKWSDRVKPCILFCVTFGIYLVVRLMSRFTGELTHDFIVFHWVELYLTLLFPFTLGLLSAKCVDVERLRGGLASWASVAIVIIAFCVIIALRNTWQSVFYPFYVTIFILAFVCIKGSETVNCILSCLGKRSTSIWFVHTWFCYYLFQDFIYSFSYPALIYLVLLAVSYGCSIVIDLIYKKCMQLIKW